MYYIIETLDQLKVLYNLKTQKAFVEVIPFNSNVHPALNKVSLVYIRPFDDTKGYLICVNHSETLHISKNHVESVLKDIPELWVRNKKQFLYYFQIKACCDVSLISPTDIQPTFTHQHIYQRFPYKQDINRIIPVVKHYELCETVYNQIKPLIPHHLPEWFEFYNNRVTLALFGIEKNGITFNKPIFEKYYETNQDYYSIDSSKIFTQYNIYTTTRRPANSYNGINFAALKKETRSSFIPSNDIFVEMDISAYHPTLAAQLIGYDFGDKDIHGSFAEMYGVDYKTAKEITFKQLYGGIFEEYKELEYFKKTIDDWSTEWSISKIADVRNWIYICLQRNLRWTDVLTYWIESIYLTEWITANMRGQLMETLWNAESGSGWVLVTSYRIPILWEHVHLKLARQLFNLRNKVE